MARANDFMLTAEELRLRKRKRRRLVIVLALLLVLGLGAFFGARPTRNAIKGWQARRHAEKAFALIEQEKWKEAKDAAIAAYQLRPGEPEALRAVARFLSRTRQPQALDFFTQLAERAPLTRDDRRDEAAAALSAGEGERAAAAVKELLKNKGGNPAPRDHLLVAQVALQQGARAEASAHLAKIHDNPQATERERLQAAVLGLSAAASADPETTARNQVAAWSRIKALSKGTSDASLEALVLLAQRALSGGTRAVASMEGPDTVPPTAENPDGTATVPPSEAAIRDPRSAILPLIGALTSHPLGKAPHKLLALDLQMLATPDAKQSLVDRAIAEWKDADAESLAALARWLNGKGEYQRVLDTIPVDRALGSRDLFLQHVDALGALGRWDEIKRLLESERFPLDPTMQRMYLARCHAQLGNEAASKNNWQRALEAAAGDFVKLMPLAQYAEKNDALEIAEAAYATAATTAPRLRPAQQGRIRLAQSQRDTKKLHSILADMLRLWPNDTAIQNDEAYTRLLLLPNDQPAHPELIAIERLAEHLAKSNPASLPHRTLLALTRLKQGRPVAAMQVYEGIQAAAAALSPSALAVHGAVLSANGQTEEARAVMANAPLNSLLPEEQAGTANLREINDGR